FDGDVRADVADRLAVPQPPDDVEELAGARVAAVLVQEVAVGPLFGAFPTGHHVQQEALSGVPLERRGHLCRQGRRQRAWTERDEERQWPRGRGEHGRREPRVLAPGPGRGEGAVEAELFGATDDLPQVFEGRGAVLPRRRRGDAVAAADEV